ncbi:WD repeat domain phosphoinositide-interacting protein 2 [Cichlidogyrus casuarinus]|uniref:WD repeat domain phosphoinositide-interacting protein 2 n=1 Tax=Cichlidogyrus casuarinus TaxID=1844966 RepID=A0ABD2PT56_9PLAT
MNLSKHRKHSRPEWLPSVHEQNQFYKVQSLISWNNAVCNLPELRAWPAIATRARPIKQMQVWESQTDSNVTLKPENSEEIAYVVENNLIQHALEGALKGLNQGASVDVVYGSKVESLELPKSDSWASNVRLQLDSDTVNAKLLVGADGYNSFVRQSANIQNLSWHQNLRAVVATLKMNELSNEYASLVWSTETEEAKHLMSLSKEAFIDELNATMTAAPMKSPRLGSMIENLASATFQRIGVTQSENNDPAPHFSVPRVVDLDERSRASFPIAFALATNFCAPSVALIGDAAHRVLPLAGQGLNLGIGDSQELVSQLAMAINQGTRLASSSHLFDYETNRQRAVVPFAALIESLYWLYCGESRVLPTLKLPLLAGRSLGLNMVDKTPAIKKFLMKSAMEGQVCAFENGRTKSGWSLVNILNDPINESFSQNVEPMCCVGRLFTSSLITLVSVNDMRKLNVYHSKRNHIICTYRYPKSILTIKLNRKRLVVCVEDTIFIHNILDMTLDHKIEETPLNKNGIIALSPNDQNCYLAFPGVASVGTVFTFDCNTFKSVATIKAHDGLIAALEFNSTGNLLATASVKGTVIRVFSVPHGNKLMEFRRALHRNADICSLSFSKNNSFLVAASNTTTIHIFKLNTKNPNEDSGICTPITTDLADEINCVVNSEDLTQAGARHTPSTVVSAPSSWAVGIYGWVSGLLRASTDYMPSQIAEVLQQERSFVTAILPSPASSGVSDFEQRSLFNSRKIATIQLYVKTSEYFFKISDRFSKIWGPGLPFRQNID